MGLKYPDITKVFYERIDREMANKGWRVADLSREMGVSRQSIERYFRGSPNDRPAPGIEVADRIARGLGLSLYEFIAPTSGDHEIGECYRRVGEALKSSSVAGVRELDPRNPDDRIKLHKQVLNGFRQLIDASPPEEQGKFFAALESLIVHGKNRGV